MLLLQVSTILSSPVYPTVRVGELLTPQRKPLTKQTRYKYDTLSKRTDKQVKKCVKYLERTITKCSSGILGNVYILQSVFSLWLSVDSNICVDLKKQTWTIHANTIAALTHTHIHTNTHPHTPTPHSQSVYLLIFICSEYQSCGPQAWLQSEERAVSMATERPDPTLCTRAANQTTKREERQSVQRGKKDEGRISFHEG